MVVDLIGDNDAARRIIFAKGAACGDENGDGKGAENGRGAKGDGPPLCIPPPKEWPPG